MIKVGIIIASTRPGRVGDTVAHWVHDAAASAATPSSNWWT